MPACAPSLAPACDWLGVCLQMCGHLPACLAACLPLLAAASAGCFSVTWWVQVLPASCAGSQATVGYWQQPKHVRLLARPCRHHSEHMQHVQGCRPGGAGCAHTSGYVPASGNLPHVRRHRRAVHAVRHMPRRWPGPVSPPAWPLLLCSSRLVVSCCQAESAACLWGLQVMLQHFPVLRTLGHCLAFCSTLHALMSCCLLLACMLLVHAAAASASRCGCQLAWTRAAGCACAARAMQGAGECLLATAAAALVRGSPQQHCQLHLAGHAVPLLNTALACTFRLVCRSFR